MTRAERSWWIGATVGLVALILLVAMQWQRIQGYDETFYLSNGLNIAGTFSGADAPLYSLWYYFLSLFSGNLFFLYYFNWAAQVVLSAILVFLIFRDDGLVAASLLTMGALVCPYYFLWPYVNLFASNVFLLFMLIVLKARPGDFAFRVTMLALCFLALMFARPEFIITAYLMLVGLVGYVAYRAWYRKAPVSFGPIIGAVALAVVVLVAHKMFFGDSTRSAVAFAQHYNLRMLAMGAIDENPWRSSKALVDFGLAELPDSIAGFFFADPARFLSHLTANALSPPFLALALLFLVNLAMAYKRWSDWGPNGDTILTLTVLGVYAPALAGSMLIYPKPAYMMVAYFLNVIVFGRSVFVRRLLRLVGASPKGRVALGALAFAAAVAAMGVVTAWKLRHPLPDLEEVVACIRSQAPPGQEGQARVLDALRGVTVYLGPRFGQVQETDIRPDETLDGFFDRTRPTFVVMESRIEEYVDARFGQGSLAQTLTGRGFAKACEGQLWAVYKAPAGQG